MLSGYTFQIALSNAKQKRYYSIYINKYKGLCKYVISKKLKNTFILTDKNNLSSWSQTQKDSWKNNSIPIINISWLDYIIEYNSIPNYKDYLLSLETLNTIQNNKSISPLQSKNSTMNTSVSIINTEELSDNNREGWEDGKVMVFRKNKEQKILSIQIKQSSSILNNNNLYRICIIDLNNGYCEYINTINEANILFNNHYNSFIKNNYTRIHSLSINPIFQNNSSTNSNIISLINKIYLNAWKSSKAILNTTSDNFQHLIPSLDNLEKAESIIIRLLDILQNNINNNELFNTLSLKLSLLLPFTKRNTYNIKILSKELDNIQLLKDSLNIGESISQTGNINIGLLNCNIELLSNDNIEYKSLNNMILSTIDNTNYTINIYTIKNHSDSKLFNYSINNQQLLFHGTHESNILGILNHGLMIPKSLKWDSNISLTRKHGLLGQGIYFSDRVSTSLKYFKSDNKNISSLYLIICQVALGNSQIVYNPCFGITSAPNGYNSVHAVPKPFGDFTEDEYCIYNTNQQQLRYIIELLPKNQQKHINIQSSSNILPNFQNEFNSPPSIPHSPYTIINQNNNKKTSINTLVGLLTTDDSNSNKFILSRTDCRITIIDMIANANLFFVYKNTSNDYIEGKFVFPLEGTVAVNKFECYINNKHIKGILKEKEKARIEYNKAIEDDKGAYLLEQNNDEDNIWSIAIGNLPPNASILIHIGYLDELCIENNEICFSLPSFISQLQHNTILQSKIISSTKTNISSSPISLEIGIEMPFTINNIESKNNHQILLKKSQTKACIQLKDTILGEKAFKIGIQTENLYNPRMWIEENEDGNHAAMISVFPKSLDYLYNNTTKVYNNRNQNIECIIVIDRSFSMKENIELLKETLHYIIDYLANTDTIVINILSFGSCIEYLFPISKNIIKVQQSIHNFIDILTCNYGGTFPIKPLQSLELLYNPLQDNNKILFLTDGHFGDNSKSILSYINNNLKNYNLYIIGLGKNILKHNLYSISRIGKGYVEFINTSNDINNVVKKQIDRFFKASLTNISIEWITDNYNNIDIKTTPSTFYSIYEGERQISYCLLDKNMCTSATFKGLLYKSNGTTEEINITLNCPELCMIRNSNIIHSLAVKSIINDYESDSLCYSLDKTTHNIIKAETKQSIINLSISYQIASKYTSFLAIESRDESEQSIKLSYSKMKEKLEFILGNHNIDPISEIGWDSDKFMNSLLSWDFTEVDTNISTEKELETIPVIISGKKSKKPKKKQILVAQRNKQILVEPSKNTKKKPFLSAPLNNISKPTTKVVSIPKPKPTIATSVKIQPILQRKGTGAATRSSVKLRNKVFISEFTKDDSRNNIILTNTRNIISPFGFKLIKTPKNFIDSALLYVLKGPINKIKGGSCWLDSILALGLTIIDDYSHFKQPYRNVPYHITNDWIKQESIEISLCRFYCIWLFTDFNSYYFHKDISSAREVLWIKFEDYNFNYGDSVCVIQAFKILCSIIENITKEKISFVEYNSISKSILLHNNSLSNQPLICINNNYSSIDMNSFDILLGYKISSFINFENVFYSEDTNEQINHFTTIALDNKGYYIYDDLLNIGDKGYQGGFVHKSSKCYKTNLLLFLKNVPIIILKP